MQLKRRPTEPGGLLSAEAQAELAKKARFAKSIANAKTDSNRWFYVAVCSMLMTCVTAFGWHKADKRFAENVRVAWVKLEPNGTYHVDYADEKKPIDYFTATVESKLMEYAEKRFSARRDSISTDYGFAALMMEPQLKTDFMENFKAPEKAASLLDCKECAQVVNKVRTIQSIDKDLSPGTSKKEQYTTLVFSTIQHLDKNGRISTCENKIITLFWTFRPRAQIVDKTDELRYNPLGMGMIRDTMRDDPTPISDAECRKL